MYVSTPTEFAEKVERIANDKELYKDIKRRQRLSVYNKFKEYITDDNLIKYETFLNIK